MLMINTNYIWSSSRRPEPFRAGVRLTYANSNIPAAINATTLLDERKVTDLVFCAKRSCDEVPVCYCCAPDPSGTCYDTRNECRAHCRHRKIERSQWAIPHGTFSRDLEIAGTVLIQDIINKKNCADLWSSLLEYCVLVYLIFFCVCVGGALCARQRLEKGAIYFERFSGLI